MCMEGCLLQGPPSYLRGRPGAPPRPTAPSSSPRTPPAASLHATSHASVPDVCHVYGAWAAAPIYAKALLLCPVVTCMRSSASSSASSSSSPTRLSTSRRNIACAVNYAAADARHVTARKIRLAFYCVCIPDYKQNRQCIRCVQKALHLCKQNELNNQGSVQE